MTQSGMLLLVLALVLWVTPAAAQSQLTDQQVARAIARADKLPDPYVCVGSDAAGEFTVCLQGPEQRIGVAAKVAKQAHRRLRPADVSAAMRRPTWTVVIRPNPPSLVDGRPVRAPRAEGVVLQGSAQPGTVVKPVEAATIPVAWNNAVGVTVTGQGLTATFDAPLLPEHDLTIVVAGDTGADHRYLLSERARLQIH